jgi:hypothetical protein
VERRDSLTGACGFMRYGDFNFMRYAWVSR